MKNITLIKQIDDIQLGHLFEHIYCAQLAEYFRNSGLFAYLDYFMSARTYYDGAVVLQVELYTDEAISHAESLHRLNIELNDDTIAAGLLQVMSEKHADIDTYDAEKVIQKLTTLQQKDWKVIDSTSIVPMKKTRRVQAAFTLQPRSERQFGIIQQTIAIDRSYIATNRDILLPLFVIISKALRSNLQEDIANNSFCYTYEDYFVATNSSYKDINKYRIDKRENRGLSTEIEITKRLIDTMEKHLFTERFAKTLGSLNNKEPLLYPNQAEIAEKAGVLVGEDAWAHIATKSNIEELLSHITVEYKYGTQKQSIKLSQL